MLRVKRLGWFVERALEAFFWYKQKGCVQFRIAMNQLFNDGVYRVDARLDLPLGQVASMEQMRLHRIARCNLRYIGANA